MPLNAINMGNAVNQLVDGLTLAISVLHSAGPVRLQERPFFQRLWKMSGNSDPGRIVNHFPEPMSE